MQRTSPPAPIRLTALLGLLLLLGCVPPQPPVHYYGLSPRPGETAGSKRTRSLWIGIRDVVLPEYLDRSQIVRRSGPDVLDVADSHLWLEQLAAGISRTLALDLAQRLETDHVYTARQQTPHPFDYVVDLHLFSFELQPDGRVHLDVRWELSNRRGRLVESRRQHIRVGPVVPASDPAAQASAMSKALGLLADSIAGRLATDT